MTFFVVCKMSQNSEKFPRVFICLVFFSNQQKYQRYSIYIDIRQRKLEKLTIYQATFSGFSFSVVRIYSLILLQLEYSFVLNRWLDKTCNVKIPLWALGNFDRYFYFLIKLIKKKHSMNLGHLRAHRSLWPSIFEAFPAIKPPRCPLLSPHQKLICIVL